jgi:hypothetical protein
MDPDTFAVMLIGLGGLGAGVVGLLLPPSHRLGAFLALVAGAGVGVVVLSTALPNGPDEDLFLTGSILGFVTVVGMLALAWRRSSADRSARRPGTTGSV